ncbi:SDR family oxidoreductase [Pelagicoccus sp. SDUM812002]|uniref:SDR family oxidoreductase n=1 Tax=Pelagicoccus sp. SDUM812002 TaxID=3041266 RepID=UPI00280F3460|nr:SDR family oxidoreductase [Pelagicoccus sp. SDUM812002]MDQ8187615.1 SDR family oxidoreductase [Pelagicoccus sp. SDUM812002]
MTSKNEYQGKVALVTGATSGIGRKVAQSILTLGAKVAVNYHSEDEKKEETERDLQTILTVAGRPRSDLMMVKANIAEAPEVEDMFTAVEKQLGSLDILVNNAGVQSDCPSHELENDRIQLEISVNLIGPILCCREALKAFLAKPKSKGCIVNISSVHEKIPKPGFLPYSVSKGGLRNLTRTLALEYADRNIRVNSVGPGAVDTKMNSKLSDDAVRKETLENIPVRKIIDPAEIARCVAYLVSDESKNLTGQSIIIDGGLSLYPSFQENWSSK